MNGPLSGFQTSCEAALVARLKPLNVELLNRTVQHLRAKGLARFFDHPSEVGIRAEVGAFTIWIYEDGCQIHASELDKHYESEDYDTLDDLCKKFVADVAELAQPRITSEKTPPPPRLA
jgi:hypothetical protein